MKTIFIKISLIISFLIILFPNVHTAIPNGIMMLFWIFDVFDHKLETNLNPEFIIYSILIVSNYLSFLFMILRSKMLNTLGIVLQYIWLFYIFQKSLLNEIVFIVTVSLYIVVSLLLVFQLFFIKKKTN